MSGGDETPQDGVGKLLDGVRWSYQPKAVDRSPLVSAEQYFADFPWDPEPSAKKSAAENRSPASPPQ